MSKYRLMKQAGRYYIVLSDCNVKVAAFVSGFSPTEAEAIVAAANEIEEKKEVTKTCEIPVEHLEEALALFDDMSRFVGNMALKDYAAFNQVPINLRRAISAKGE